jgi:hypothetical protein
MFVDRINTGQARQLPALNSGKNWLTTGADVGIIRATF